MFFLGKGTGRKHPARCERRGQHAADVCLARLMRKHGFFPRVELLKENVEMHVEGM